MADEADPSAPTKRRRIERAAALDYESLDKAQLIRLLRRHDATRKVGLVWERTRSAEELNEAFVVLDRQEEIGVGPTSNCLIHGNNHDALRFLRMTHRGRVRVAYLDPPYNTRSAFEAYDDNFEHSVWLSAMQVRLELVRDLLSPDGSIWISIDDREGHYLKVLMDEVFGRRNFVASFIWRKVDSPNENRSKISPDHEHILCYAIDRDTALARFRKLPDPSILDAYPQEDEHGRKVRDRLIKKNGRNSLRADRPTMWFPITAPDGTEVWPVHDDGREARWAKGKKAVAALQKAGKIVWKQREFAGALRWVPYSREVAPHVPERPHPTILLDCDTMRQAKAHLTDLLPGSTPFDTVKPERLLRRILDVASSRGDLILDPYLGSGTTAAVAQKMGRRWIGVEAEDSALSLCLPRLRKVIEGEAGGISEIVGWEGGGGFSVLSTRQVPSEDIPYDLDPDSAWTAIELIHGVPLLSPQQPAVRLARSAVGAAGEMVSLIDSVTEDALDEVSAWLRQGRTVTVWSWSPGAIVDALGEHAGLTVMRLPDALQRRFES